MRLYKNSAEELLKWK